MKEALRSCFVVDTIQLINAPHGGIYCQETFKEMVLSITDKALWQKLSRSISREWRTKLQLPLLQKCSIVSLHFFLWYCTYCTYCYLRSAIASKCWQYMQQHNYLIHVLITTTCKYINCSLRVWIVFILFLKS